MQLDSVILTTEKTSAAALELYYKADAMYYIQNAGVVGNCARWWRPNSCGYTCNLDEAGKYTYDEAARLVRNRPDQDSMWPVEYIDGLAVRHVDCQHLPSLEELLA
jgi:hypothetical protein